MIKRLFFTLTLFISSLSFAETPYYLIGWHWYNEPIKQKKEITDKEMEAFNRLSPTKKVEIIGNIATQLKNKAILTGKVEDVADYKRVQDFIVKRADIFKTSWEKMLLQHPELNYALQHSYENALASVMQREKHQKEDKAIAELADENGLLFFYRKNNKGDQLFSRIMDRYTKKHHLAMIPIAVDDPRSDGLSRKEWPEGIEKAHALGINYFPALVLVNPTTEDWRVVSYGFKSESELSDRILKIHSGWKEG